MTPELVEALLAAGPDSDPYLAIEDQGALDELEFYLLPTRDLVFTVRALARTLDGGTFLREAVIELGGSLGPALPRDAAARSALRPADAARRPPDVSSGQRAQHVVLCQTPPRVAETQPDPSSARSGVIMSQPRPATSPWRAARPARRGLGVPAVERRAGRRDPELCDCPGRSPAARPGQDDPFVDPTCRRRRRTAAAISGRPCAATGRHARSKC